MSEWKSLERGAVPHTQKASNAAAPKPTNTVDMTMHTLRDLVVTMEHQVHELESLAGMQLTEAVSKLVSRSDTSIIAIVVSNTMLPDSATAWLERLDRSIARLYSIARRAHVRMQETGLAALFDHADDLANKTGTKPANRADAYYDEPIARTTNDTEPASTSSELVVQLLDEGAGEKQPKNRDELVARIQGFSTHLTRALDEAFYKAFTILKEPSAPKRPELLEALAELAADLLVANAGAALGTLIAAGFGRIGKLVELEEHIGKGLTESLTDGFKDTAKELPKKAGAILEAKPEEEHAERTNGLSAKSMYLMAAKNRTNACMNATDARFAALGPQLKRVPVTTLEGVANLFTNDLSAKITSEFTNQIVLEWINFGKEAMERGEEVRDSDIAPKHPSKLDAAYGVVEISMVVDRAGQVLFTSAEIPGLSDAVFANLTGQKQNLATLRIARHVIVRFEGSEHLCSFDIDADGTLTEALSRISSDNRVALANLSPHKPGHSFDDAVVDGMHAIVARLTTVGSAKIERGV